MNNCIDSHCLKIVFFKSIENGIGDEGISTLCELLKVNASLTQLNLRSNSLHLEGLSEIREALKSNSSLTQLNLEGEKVKENRYMI